MRQFWKLFNDGTGKPASRILGTLGTLGIVARPEPESPAAGDVGAGNGGFVRNKAAQDEAGVWRTIHGSPVFIKEGQSVEDAIREKTERKNPPAKVEADVRRIGMKDAVMTPKGAGRVNGIVDPFGKNGSPRYMVKLKTGEYDTFTVADLKLQPGGKKAEITKSPATDQSPPSPIQEWVKFKKEHEERGDVVVMEDIKPFLKGESAGVAALHAYVHGGFTELATAPDSPEAKALLKFIDRLPDEQIDAMHRGLGFYTEEERSKFLSQFSKGGEYTQDRTLTSWTLDDPMAKGATGSNNQALDQALAIGEHLVVLTVRHPRRVKDISFIYFQKPDAKSKGDELVQQIGSRYSVSDVKKVGDKYHVILDQSKTEDKGKVANTSGNAEVLNMKYVVVWPWLANAGCGTGAGGFQPGNTCGVEGGHLDKKANAEASINPGFKGRIDADAVMAVDKAIREDGIKWQDHSAVQDVDPSTLVPSEWNSMGTQSAQVSRMREADLSRTGPIVVLQKANGTMEIINGLHRAEVAKQMGRKVRAVVIDEALWDVAGSPISEEPIGSDIAIQEWANEKFCRREKYLNHADTSLTNAAGNAAQEPEMKQVLDAANDFAAKMGVGRKAMVKNTQRNGFNKLWNSGQPCGDSYIAGEKTCHVGDISQDKVEKAVAKKTKGTWMEAYPDTKPFTQLTTYELNAKASSLPKTLNGMTEEQKTLSANLYRERVRRWAVEKETHDKQIALAQQGDKYPDGRMKPKIGNEVFMTTGGMFGSVAHIYGTVVPGAKGLLRVKVTGSQSTFGGGGYSGPKSVLLTPQWTVKGDPELKRREEAKAAKEEAAKDAKAKAAVEEDAARQTSYKSGIDSGHEPFNPDILEPGDLVVDHSWGKPNRMVVTEKAPNTSSAETKQKSGYNWSHDIYARPEDEPNQSGGFLGYGRWVTQEKKATS